MSEESDVEVKGYIDGQNQVDKVLSGEFRWMSRLCTSESAVETCSTSDSSVDETSSKSEIDTSSDRNFSTGSELPQLAIHTILAETRARDLDRESYQEPDSDHYLLPSGKVFDNAADDR